MPTSQPAGTDLAFEAFRQDHRAKVVRRRRVAVEQLLVFAASAPRAFDEREQTQAEDFLKELHALAWEEIRVLPPDRIEPVPRVSRSRVRTVHAEVRRASVEIFPTNPSDQWQMRSWRPPMHARVPMLVSEHGRVGQMLEAGWPDTVWVSIMSLLEEFGREIRRCGVCAERRLFLKRRRQEYCSRQCSQRARSARWYTAHRPEAQRRRRTAYQKQVKTGYPRAKITTRTRRPRGR